MSGCLWGEWHKLSDKKKEKIKEFLKFLDERKGSMETPKETNIILKEDFRLRPEQSVVDELTARLCLAQDHIAELESAISAFIEVLEMAIPQTGKQTNILKTEGGEEIDCLLIPKEEVESVLERYK